ncbi:MAG: acyltransferase [Kiritimatiellae bacterium]|nr:acyltransferase [Kiritimatiellia bacterium]
MQKISSVISRKISNANAIGALMVVAIHVAGRGYEVKSPMWWWESLTHYGLFQIAVPMFFYCSGYLLAGRVAERNWYRCVCLKRFRSLLVPYVIWAAICAGIPAIGWLIVDLWRGEAVHCSQYSLSLTSVFGLSFREPPHTVSLWFLRCLMLFVVLSPIWVALIFHFKRVAVLLLYGMSLIVGVMALTRDYSIVATQALGFFFSIFGLFWFCAGMFMRIENLDLAVGRLGGYLSLFMGCAVIVASALIEAKSGVSVVALARVVYVPLIFVPMWKYLHLIQIPRWLCDSSFPVYLMHGLVLQFFRPVILMICSPFVGWVLLFCIGVVVPAVLSEISKKYCKSVASLLFGGR